MEIPPNHICHIYLSSRRLLWNLPSHQSHTWTNSDWPNKKWNVSLQGMGGLDRLHGGHQIKEKVSPIFKGRMHMASCFSISPLDPNLWNVHFVIRGKMYTWQGKVFLNIYFWSDFGRLSRTYSHSGSDCYSEFWYQIYYRSLSWVEKRKSQFVLGSILSELHGYPMKYGIHGVRVSTAQVFLMEKRKVVSNWFY